MKVYSDTSLLCAIYREQDNSKKADVWMASLQQRLSVSAFLLLEFKQSIRFHAWFYEQNRSKGFSKNEGAAMLRALQSDLIGGVLEMVAPDWADVHRIAEELSAKHTEANGHRLADILHVATAIHLGVEKFLTFDRNQKRLAEAEGMEVPV